MCFARQKAKFSSSPFRSFFSKADPNLGAKLPGLVFGSPEKEMRLLSGWCLIELGVSR